MTRVLALDVGTSSVRARVYDGDGRPVAGVEGKVRYTETRGHSGRLGAFDADELVAAASAAVDEARREAGGGIDAVAASCFWHSVVPVGARGRPLAPVLTWRDVRSAPEAVELGERLDAREVHRRTGCHLHPSFWPAKLLWLRRTAPEAFAAAARFLSFSDYLLLRIEGDARTSLSMASGTGLLDVGAARWDEEVLDAVGVGPDRLPAISDDPVDGWYPALGDGACANAGVGALTRQRAALSIGTSGALRTVFEAADADPRPGLFLYRLDARRLVEGGSLSDGGNLWDWLERTFRLDDVAGLADEPADGHGLTFLALLGGERSPGWRANARGALQGLTFETTPRDVAHAALEGVAFRFAEIAALMPEVEDVVATGGALRASADWAQILADVLGRPVALSAVEESSARGAAVVVLERLGERPEAPAVERVFEPRPERAATYARARERQRNLYAAVTGSSP